MKLPSVPIDTEYIAFGGGIDLATPALAKKSGFCIDALNYEPGINGGYSRIDGYERFDGRVAPSDAVYYYATFRSWQQNPPPTVGATVTGATSGATGVVASIDDEVIILTKVIGAFVEEFLLTSGGGLPLLLMMYDTATSGLLTSTPVENGAPTVYDDAVALNAAADVYRNDVGKVPGSESVLGVGLLHGVTYAFKNNQLGTAALLWKALSTGWANVPLGYEVSFTSGGTATILDGDTVTGATSGGTGIVSRVVLESGTFAGGTAAGRLILSSKTGIFQAGEAISASLASNPDMATASGPATEITLLPNGRYEIVNDNFSASEDTMRMYGCDGVNRGFECDGTVFVPIDTGMDEDTPLHVFVHKKQLFLSFRGSSQNSGIGTPYKWTVVSGAAEIGVGDRITGYEEVTEDALAIFGRNRTDKLLGSSVADFDQKTIAPKYGAIPYTTQNVGTPIFLDDQGIRRIIVTQNYGGIADRPDSYLVQPLIDLLRGRAVASVVYRHRSQYRVFADDGSGLMLGTRGDKVIGITALQYPCVVTCTCAGEDSTGKDVVFFGASDGYVYQGDKGSSFDGEEIEGFIRPVFNHSKSPRIRKRYRKGILEMESRGYAEIRVQPEFTYGSQDIAESRSQLLTATGPGGYWESAVYDTIIYDGQTVQNPEFPIEGSGTNIAPLFYSNSDIDLGHTLQGFLLHFTPRRIAR